MGHQSKKKTPGLLLIVRTLAWVTCACLLLTGCPPTCDDLQEQPWLLSGTSESSFTPLNDGDRLPVVFGPQGGAHVTLALKAGGVHPGWLGQSETYPTVTADIFNNDTLWASNDGHSRRLDPAEDGSWKLTELRVTLRSMFSNDSLPQFEPETSFKAGPRDYLRLHLEDVCGNVVEDEVGLGF